MMIHLIHLIFMVNQPQLILEQVNFIFFFIKSNFILLGLDGDNLLLLDHYPPAAGSTFHVDPFGMAPQPVRETNSPLNMFSSTLINANNNFFAQSQPQLIPTRIPTPAATTPAQSPLPIKKLTLNPTKKKNELVTDLLDFGDPNPPPPPPESPKFDPYA